MKKHIKIIITCIFIIVALSLTSCQDCAKTHDVQYTYYTNHCVAYGDHGNCIKEVPMKNTSVTSHCDEWKS